MSSTDAAINMKIAETVVRNHTGYHIHPDWRARVQAIPKQENERQRLNALEAALRPAAPPGDGGSP